MSKPAGIYIHVPFCSKKCPYCDFYSCAYRKGTAESYVAAACRNIAALPEQLACDTVYFGGGTPSLLPATAIRSMLDAVRKRCALTEHAEITLEANPLTLTAEKLHGWQAAGINRLSIGVQSFQSEVLSVLRRMHLPQQAMDAVLRAYDAGFENLSVDLMIGTAVQTADAVQRDLETVLSLSVPHLSVYMLKIEENTPFGMHPPAMTDADETAERYLQLHDVLTAAGYLHYEISNFAKPGFESRHNCKYWQLVPYYGIGPAAHSCFDGKRYAVPCDLDGFLRASLQTMEITEPVADSESERVMLGLRLKEGIMLDSVPQSREALLRAAKPLIPKYLRLDGARLTMTPEGWLVSNAVLAHLL